MGRNTQHRPPGTRQGPALTALTAFLDTNILIRHFTGDPPDLAVRADAFIDEANELLLPDLIVAETVYVLESYYGLSRDEVAEVVRSVISYRSIHTRDPALLMKSLEIYQDHRIDFAEAYLAAAAESTGVGTVASFDRGIDRVPTIIRVEP